MEERSRIMAGEVNEVKATKKIGDVERAATILYDFGGDLDSAVEKFGKDTVYANFVRSSVITAQAAMRRYLEDGKSEEEIADKMANWKPGVPMERAVDPIAATISKFAKMDEAAKNALLEQLLSLAGKK
jgi:hypothetical protein